MSQTQPPNYLRHPPLDLRARAVTAVLESPSYHRTELDTARHETLLRCAAHEVGGADLPTADPQSPHTPAVGRDPQFPVSRREALLFAAIRLFAERGYPAVSLGNIGAAAGIAGPSIYNYFPTKHDLRISGLNRGNEALWLALHHAMAGADGPLDAVNRSLDSYVAFAVANPDIVAVILAETVHLPQEQRDQYRRLQQDYVTELVALLRRHRPELSDSEARILLNAALSLSNTLARVKHLRRRAGLPREISALTRAVVLKPDPRRTEKSLAAGRADADNARHVNFPNPRAAWASGQDPV